jgi:5S rRNA maturation endonuclease (ribonuclease M5)
MNNQYTQSNKARSIYKWNYLDKQGVVIGYVERFEDCNGKKSIIPFFNRDNGKFISGAHPKPRPLFGLHLLKPELINKSKIIIVEGEKCAHALQSLGFTALSWQGGAQQVKHTDWSPLIEVNEIILLPDNDDGGKKAMDTLKQILEMQNSSLNCQIINFDNLEPKDDIVNIIQGFNQNWDGYRDFTLEEKSHLRTIIKNMIKDKLIKSTTVKQNEKQKWLNIKGMDISELISTDMPPRECLVGNWLERYAPIMICGAPKAGKTYFSYALAYAMSQGTAIYKWECPSAVKVCILDGEMRPRMIQERICKQVANAVDVKPENLIIFTRESFTNHNVLPPDLSITKERTKLLELVKDFDVLILDNINVWFRSGNENDTNFWVPVEQFVLELRDRKITPILIHHTTKSSPKSPAGSSKAERIPEVIIVLEKIGNDNGAYFNVIFHSTRDYSTDTNRFSVKLVEKLDGNQSWMCGDYIEQIDLSYKGKHNQDQIQSAYKDYESGLSIRKIAEITGIPKSTLSDSFKKLQVANE